MALDGERFPLEPERVSTLRPDANVANGMALDLEGRLLVCEQGTRSQHAAVTRLDPATGGMETVVDEWARRRLNSPNDVVAKNDGTVWFTDPSYGYLQGFRPEPQVSDHVYRYDPASGDLSVVAYDVSKPNGLAFSADERILYVTDSGANQEPDSFYDELPAPDRGLRLGGRPGAAPTAASSPSPRPAFRTGSRSTARDTSTPPRSQASRSSTRPAS